jgi:hypothetical protein
LYRSEKDLIREIKGEIIAETQSFQSIKDSVKDEVLAEIRSSQQEWPAVPPQHPPLSERKIGQMIDARFQALDDLKAEIKKELHAIQEIEARRTEDPYIRQVAASLAGEARKRGIPHEKLMDSLEQKSDARPGMMGRLSRMINTGQRKGFLYGMGMMVLCQLLLPSTRGKMYSVAVRSMEEGMAMMDRARTFVSGCQQQAQPGDPAGPGPPPDGQQPSGDEHVEH